MTLAYVYVRDERSASFDGLTPYVARAPMPCETDGGGDGKIRRHISNRRDFRMAHYEVVFAGAGQPVTFEAVEALDVLARNLSEPALSWAG